MRFNLLLASFFFLLSAFIFPVNAFAATFTITGNVSDALGNAISNASVTATNSSNGVNAGSTNTNNDGSYSLTVDVGTYNVQITPPDGSSFVSAIAPSKVIDENTVLNFTLVSVGDQVMLTGYIKGDKLSNPLPNQLVRIGGENNFNIDVYTNEEGKYTASVPPGTYTLQIRGTGNSTALQVPQNYEIYVSNYTISQTTLLDFVIPSKKVSVNIQNSVGTPLENVKLEVSGYGAPVNVGNGITNALSMSSISDPLPTSGQNGNIEILLTPNINGNGPYVFTATPPQGSNYSVTTRSDIIFSEDIEVTIAMQERVTLSGYIYGDNLNNPLPNQLVRLSGSNNYSVDAYTDENGFFQMQARPETYDHLLVSGNGNSSALHVPQVYTIVYDDFSLTEDKQVSVKVPAKEVEVIVQDSGGARISNATVKVSGYGGIVAVGDDLDGALGLSSVDDPLPVTDMSGTTSVWLFPNQTSNPYTFIITPPSSSGLERLTNPSVILTDDVLTLTIPRPHTLSGKVFSKSTNNPVSGQKVQLDGDANFVASAITNDNGEYSLQAPPGTYSVSVRGRNADPNVALPQQYEISARDFQLTEDKNLDFLLPVKEVTIHVQNAVGEPVQGIEIRANGSGSQVTLGNSVTNAFGASSYGNSDAGPLTDSAGNAKLWLLPIENYTFRALPANNSIYSEFVINNVNVVSNQTQIISLQYTHQPPQTSIVLETESGSEQYSNPTTVTLSAEAADGYSVAQTYYRIDGGEQLIYSTPFIITGEGDHTVEYWSVDTSSIQESHKTKTFTIYQNQAPVVDPFAGGIITAGQVFSANSFFTDEDSTSWTATVDYGDGAGQQPLTLSGQNFALSHEYNTAGEYDVTVVITDESQNTGTTITKVTVNANNMPVINQFPEVSITEGSSYNYEGSFNDSDSISWTATVNYGDGSGPQPLSLDANKTFELSHLYKDNGYYLITVTISDNQDATATSSSAVTVLNAVPVIGAITASINPVQVNTSLAATTSFNDAGVLDTHTVLIDWGDGIVIAGNINNGSISASHTYTTAGVYEITMTVTDNNGGSNSKRYQYQAVYDQNSGWVAGSKEFTSPAGSLVQNPNVTGQVDFGFQVKYVAGNPVPSGKNVEFAFPAGNIDFSSTSYQWLVVSGTKATFKANGTLNGIPGYTLLVSAIDQGTGQQKGLIRFQIKNANDSVIYDSQIGSVDTADPTTSVSKGKIAVH